MLGKHPDGTLLSHEKQVIRPDMVNKGNAAIDSYIFNDLGRKNLRLDYFKTDCLDILSSIKFAKWAAEE